MQIATFLMYIIVSLHCTLCTVQIIEFRRSITKMTNTNIEYSLEHNKLGLMQTKTFIFYVTFCILYGLRLRIVLKLRFNFSSPPPPPSLVSNFHTHDADEDISTDIKTVAECLASCCVYHVCASGFTSLAFAYC